MPLSQNEFADVADHALFRAVKLQQWPQTRELLQEQPSLVRECDTYGNTVLHSAIGYKAPDDVLLQLLRVYPQAASVHGTEDWTPLHVASMWGCSVVVMEALIMAHPKALDDAGQGGIKGRTPRHFCDRFPATKHLLQRSTEEWIKICQEPRPVMEEEKSNKDDL